MPSTMSAVADIPVVILCGGMGTRLREASEKLPKPLVDIGGRPILWHIMKVYAQHGFRRFVLCLGYKGDQIKHYFLDHRTMTSDFTLCLGNEREIEYHRSTAEEDWQVTFAETGLLSGTGARIRRIRPYLRDADTFLLTYGDGIGDVDVTALLAQHRDSGRVGTVTAVHPAGRYGEMTLSEDGAGVAEFNEKPASTSGWVSGGFFVFDRSFADDYLDDDADLFFERRPLQRLAADGQLAVHLHEGFWMGMDTYRDWTELNALWDRGEAPWCTWTPDCD
ncbi:MAG TPA: glucose-1-phosphate cytidylyltransferase [Mycobacteriales bacterium]|nr:glucose-1-phosphate cytidylyltransferase [Mycobacteriales bacterium]